MTEHTKARLKILGDDSSGGVAFIDVTTDAPFGPDFKQICQVQSTLDDESDDFVLTEEDRANAARVVLTWNSHDALVDALEHAEAILSRSRQISTNCNGLGPSTTTTNALKMVRAALALATEQDSGSAILFVDGFDRYSTDTDSWPLDDADKSGDSPWVEPTPDERGVYVSDGGPFKKVEPGQESGS